MSESGIASELVFVEHDADVRRALEYCAGHPGASIVALTCAVMWRLEKHGRSYITPYDYFQLDELRDLNEELYARTERLCAAIQTRVLNRVPRVAAATPEIGQGFYHPVKVALNTVCHRLLILIAVVRRIGPGRAVIFEPRQRATADGLYLNPDEVPIFEELAKHVLRASNVAVVSMESANADRLDATLASFGSAIGRSLVRRARAYRQRLRAYRGERATPAVPPKDGVGRLDVLSFRASYSVAALCDRLASDALGQVITFEHYRHRDAPERRDDKRAVVREFDALWDALERDPEFNAALTFRGINLRPVLGGYLRRLSLDGSLRILAVYRKARAILDLEGVNALLMPTVTYPEEWACAAACRQTHVPVVIWQHGSYAMFTPHTQPLYYDLHRPDYCLVFGKGVEDAFASAQAPRRAQVIPVGSATLDKIQPARHHAAPAPGRRRTIVVPLRSLNVQLFGDSYQVYPPAMYWRELKDVLGVFGAMPEFDFILKLYPGNKLESTPVADFVNTMGWAHIAVREKPGFSKLLPLADLVVIDWPYTTLLEAAKADLPIICYDKLWRLSSAVKPLLDRRCFSASSPEALRGLLHDFAEDRMPARRDTAFLERYGTHMNDGDSVSRAVAHLSQIVAARAHPMPASGSL